MLLNDNVQEYAPRPAKLFKSGRSDPIIFREEGTCRRPAGSDQWTNSGGKKGSSIWPGSIDTARIRCKYGRVIIAGDSSQDVRYRMYTFIGSSAQAAGRKSRRLYVVQGSMFNKKTLTPPPTVSAPAADAKSPAIVSRIHRLLSSLESQAAASGYEVDIETVSQLITAVGDLPSSASQLLQNCERPIHIEGNLRRSFFVELEPNKRRALSRAGGRPSCPSTYSCLDKWANAGGKRGIVRLKTASGTMIQRRRGRVELCKNPGSVDLRYHQYCSEANRSASDNSTVTRKDAGKVTVFHVFAAQSQKLQPVKAPPQEPQPVQPPPQEPQLVQPVPQKLQPVQPVPQEPQLVQPISQEPQPVQPHPQEPQLAQPVPQEPQLVQPVPQELQLVQPVPQKPQLVQPISQETQLAQPHPQEPQPAQPVPQEAQPAQPVQQELQPVQPISREPQAVQSVPQETQPALSIPQEPRVAPRILMQAPHSILV